MCNASFSWHKLAIELSFTEKGRALKKGFGGRRENEELGIGYVNFKMTIDIQVKSKPKS